MSKTTSPEPREFSKILADNVTELYRNSSAKDFDNALKLGEALIK